MSADVGGQREAVSAADLLLPAGASIEQWADAVLTAARRVRGVDAGLDPRAPEAAAHVWPWLLSLGPGAAAATSGVDVLFVTGNLDVGGAQRSLCNLAAALAGRGASIVVAVAGPVGVPDFMAAARAAGAEFIDIAGPGGGTTARAGRVMALARERSPKNLVFCNMDPATKMLVVKSMADGPARLVDVSPGPMLFRELDRAASFGLARSRAGRSCLLPTETSGMPWG